jgi:hypothetical protein
MTPAKTTLDLLYQQIRLCHRANLAHDHSVAQSHLALAELYLDRVPTSPRRAS